MSSRKLLARPRRAGPSARSAPVFISIPALGIRSPLGPPRGLNPDGTISDAPLSGPDWSLPWWYDEGPAPGQAGSAVILGHVDSAIGAGHLGVFYRLGDLPVGSSVSVRLANGTLTHWRVTSNVLYPDQSFPDTLVYAPSGPPLLRLVTCGGSFNYETHSYESAVVVTAALLGTSRAAHAPIGTTARTNGGDPPTASGPVVLIGSASKRSAATATPVPD